MCHVPLLWGDWIIYCVIVRRLISCGVLSLDLLGSVGLSKYVIGYSFWLVELVGEALVRHLESNSVVLDVVYMEGA